ncbi:methyltransferase [Nonomuraea pusilla]|uniref:FAD/FMN-containing dehydrogenase n=1 Tax=Nonomuraea pusilla TaxID=46177 RepID=A0A1H8CDG6_9ACTN|nr:methyltransferase [Nonomuraea pusilla]SEM92474.1 FAD/FMN-containing dehydrogenase [Nonomuraea pusilla]
MPSDESTLDNRIQGSVVRPGDPHYDEYRKVFNGMIDRRPSLIVRCASPADVAEGIAHARRHGLPLSVRSGGHGVTGDAVLDDSVCLDLRPMNSVTIDPDRRRALVGGGANWGEFDAAAQEYGLAVTGGRIRSTGVAGLTLGSGSGWLERKFGLTCDSLLSVELVTADGDVLRASETENSELFWGVRGGGGNFGVVTTFEFQLHPVGPQVLGGLVMYPPFQVADLIRQFRDFMATAPDEVGGALAFISAPDEPFVPEFARGKPVVGATLAYFGPIEEGIEVLRPMREFGPPVRDMVAPIAYTDLQGLLEPSNHEGMQNYWKAEFLAELPDEAIDHIVRFTQTVPSRLTQTLLMPLGGALARVDNNAMAFGQREAPFNIHIMSMWEDAADTERQISWTREFHRAVQPYSTGGAYLNFIGNEGGDRIKAAFGPEKYERLVRLKRRYDPSNVFAGNQNIPPQAEAVEEEPKETDGQGHFAPLAVLELLNGMWVARALQVAAHLRIAEQLAGGPRTLTELATECGCDPAALGRLISALSTVGFFARTAEDKIQQTPLSAVLSDDHPQSVGAVARLFGSNWQWQAWSQLEHSVRNGEPALDQVLGTSLLEFLDTMSPDDGALFDQAMTGLSRFLNRTILNAYDFSGAGRIADVSGGHSTLLIDILAGDPSLSGVLLDRPAITAKVRGRVREAGLGDRLDVVDCDFLRSLPEQADTIVLNRVLHDWDDDAAAGILRACRDALRPGGRIVAVEQLMTGDKRAAFLDLQMLVLRGGRERSREEMAELFGRSGLRIAETINTTSPMCLLIGHALDD